MSMFKKRLTYFAAIAVFADLLVLGAAWHVGPAMGLAASLAVPDIEPLLAPLYAEPVAEHTAAGVDVYRPAHSRTAVVLVRDPAHGDADVIALARALARRDLTVVVPRRHTTEETALAHAHRLGLPVRVERVAMLLEATPSSPIARAARALDLLRLANTLLAR